VKKADAAFTIKNKQGMFIQALPNEARFRQLCPLPNLCVPPLKITPPASQPHPVGLHFTPFSILATPLFMLIAMLINACFNVQETAEDIPV